MLQHCGEIFRTVLLPLLICFATSTTVAQQKNESFQFHITRTTAAIVIDGETNDGGWTDAEIAGNFFMVLPMDTGSARVRTDVRMTYDDENLYLLAECFHL